MHPPSLSLSHTHTHTHTHTHAHTHAHTHTHTHSHTHRHTLTHTHTYKHTHKNQKERKKDFDPFPTFSSLITFLHFLHTCTFNRTSPLSSLSHVTTSKARVTSLSPQELSYVCSFHELPAQLLSSNGQEITQTIALSQLSYRTLRDFSIEKFGWFCVLDQRFSADRKCLFTALKRLFRTAICVACRCM